MVEINNVHGCDFFFCIPRRYLLHLLYIVYRLISSWLILLDKRCYQHLTYVNRNLNIQVYLLSRQSCPAFRHVFMKNIYLAGVSIHYDTWYFLHSIGCPLKAAIITQRTRKVRLLPVTHIIMGKRYCIALLAFFYWTHNFLMFPGFLISK